MSASKAPAASFPVRPFDSPTVAAVEGGATKANPDAGKAAWPRWQRWVFRYLLCHCLLYSLPFPVANWLGTVASGIDYVALKTEMPELKQGAFTWPKQVAVYLAGDDNLENRVKGHVDLWWEQVTTWMNDANLAPYEVIHQTTGSGDTGAGYAQLLAIVVMSLLLTTLWSVLRRRPCGYPRLGRWLHLYARWYLAFIMLGYGLPKFYTGQFGDLGLMRLTQEIGDTMPMTMVGTFMQASKPYEWFGGACEVLAGLLLFHRRTALLGALVTIGVMANVCALNWLYGVPVKLFSTHLLLVAVFLLAPYAGRLWALLVSNRPSMPVDLAVVKNWWLGGMLALFGWSWVVCHLVDQHFSSLRMIQTIEKMRGSRPELYGLWTVESMKLDGVEVPATDATRWQFVAIDRGPRVWVREATGRRRFFGCTEQLAENKLLLKPLPAGDEQTWVIERGTKTTKDRNPVPLRLEDRQKPVDVQRRSLVLKGLWEGKQVELETVEKVFRLQTGFRLRQELPDGW